MRSLAGDDLRQQLGRSEVIARVQPQQRPARDLRLVVIAETPRAEREPVQAAEKRAVSTRRPAATRAHHRDPPGCTARRSKPPPRNARAPPQSVTSPASHASSGAGTTSPGSPQDSSQGIHIPARTTAAARQQTRPPALADRPALAETATESSSPSQAIRLSTPRLGTRRCPRSQGSSAPRPGC